MHHWLYTLRPHGDVNKFEVEDGVIRGVVAALLAKPSSIIDVLVDIPRDANSQGSFDIPGAEDHVLIAISAEQDADAQPDMATLAKDFATVESSGSVQRTEIAERERTWPGTATPGTAVRLRAAAAPGIDAPGLASWLNDALADCVTKLPGVGIRAMPAAGSTGLTAINVSLAFPQGEDPESQFTSRTLQPFLDSEILAPGSMTANMVTEHRILPNPQIWT